MRTIVTESFWPQMNWTFVSVEPKKEKERKKEILLPFLTLVANGSKGEENVHIPFGWGYFCSCFSANALFWLHSLTFCLYLSLFAFLLTLLLIISALIITSLLELILLVELK